MKGLNKAMVVMYDVFMNLTAGVLAVILITVILQVVSRYVFNRAFTWTEELCTILLVYLAFFAAPMPTIAQKHMVADFFRGLIPKKLNWALGYIIRFSSIFFFAMLAISCIHYIPNRSFKTPALQLPRYVFYIPVLIGTLAMIYAEIVNLLNEFFPGFNYYKQRQDQRDAEAARIEEQEKMAMVASMDSFMDKAEGKDKGGKS